MSRLDKQMGCNVQNNRAYQYDMICDEILDCASKNRAEISAMGACFRVSLSEEWKIRLLLSDL